MVESDRAVALVTGGAVRIGRAISLALAARRYAIAVHYRASGDDAATVARLIRDQGGEAVIVCGDLSQAADVSRIVEQAESALGPVSCLINNASIFEMDTLSDLSHDGWERQIGVNLTAPIFLAKTMAARLPTSAHGTIVNIIDQRVLSPGADFFSYTIAKSALYAATKTLALALAPRIRVNAVAPGPVLKSVHQTPTEFEQERTSTLLGRGATPEEIAEAVQFLVSAAAITGQMLAVDGGQHMARTSL